MISPEKRAQIVRLHVAEGLKPTAIGREVGVHHLTVQKTLTELGLEVVPRPQAPRLVDPYVGLLKAKLEEYPEIHASRLYGIVKGLGYSGGPDHFRAVVAQLRPKKRAEAYLRLHTVPGEQAQVDWGSFGTMQVGRAQRKLSAFVMVLSWSRSLYVRFFLGQSMSHFLRGHQDAFEFFGGVVRVALYDNLKSAVLERKGPAIRFNESLQDFSAHYGYEVRPVGVRRGNEKGRVERAIRYIRGAFFAGRAVKDLATLNEQALLFCQQEAASRKHPQDRTMTVKQAWEQERERLLPLPQVPFPVEETVAVSVGKTPYVRFDKNDYSVPHPYVCRTLSVRASEETVRIVEGNQVVAQHPRSWDQGQQVEDPAHEAELLEWKRRGRTHRGADALCRQVPGAQELLGRLGQRGENLGSATAALTRLSDHYGAPALAQAIAEALVRDAVHPHTVRLILERKHHQGGAPARTEVLLPPDSPLRTVCVVPHALSTYDVLGKEPDDDDIF